MNPYRVEGPAIISFSGGRTSAFMLRQIIDAHGGSLPEDVRPVFYNTGLEHPATYDFIETCAREWEVPVLWLEYRRTESGPSFAVVTPETASRNGEPFEAMIRAHNYLPNPVTRKCTVELKIRTGIRYCRSLGWTEWTNTIGLRADEPRRVAKMKGDVRAEITAMPMAEAGHTKADVMRFWATQPFDLELPNNDAAFGNCIGCFLKGKDKLIRVMREDPAPFEWWTRMEALALASKPSGAKFRTDRPSYAGMLEIARTQTVAFEDEDTLPCECTE